MGVGIEIKAENTCTSLAAECLWDRFYAKWNENVFHINLQVQSFLSPPFKELSLGFLLSLLRIYSVQLTGWIYNETFRAERYNFYGTTLTRKQMIYVAAHTTNWKTISPVLHKANETRGDISYLNDISCMGRAIRIKVCCAIVNTCIACGVCR